MTSGPLYAEALPAARVSAVRSPATAAAALPIGAGLVAFGVYLVTLAPTIGFLDSPELSAAALTLGVPHPTGYPLYTLLGHGFSTLLALGDPAWRLNLLSALCGGAAVAVLVALARRLSGSGSAAWISGMLFAFSSGFWSQCTIAEVYALHVLLVALVLWCWLRFDEEGGALRLAALAGVFGLALTHHLMTLLLGPALALGLLTRWRSWLRPRELFVGSVCLLAPLALYGYLPWAARRDPLVNWGDPSTPERFLLHVSGAQYHGLVDAPQAWTAVLSEYVGGLATEFGVPLVVFALLGLVYARGAPRRWAVLGLAYATSLCFAVSYGVTDPEPFFLTANLVLALFTAGGAGWLLRRVAGSTPRALPLFRAVLWLAPLLVLLGNFREQDRRLDFEAHDRALAALASAPENAILLTQGPRGYPPVYASLVERVRPDVDVVDMFVRVRDDYGAALERARRRPLPPSWTRDMAVTAAAAQAQGGSRPLLLWPDVPDLDWGALGLSRLRGGVVDLLVRGEADLRVVDAGTPQPVGGGMAFRGGPELLGVEADAARVAAGDALALAYRWKLGAGPRAGALTVTTLLADENGDVVPAPGGGALFAREHPLGQGDDLGRYGVAEQIAEHRRVLLPRSVPVGRWSLWVGVREGDRWLELQDGRAFGEALRFAVTPARSALWRPVAATPTR